MSDHLRGYGWRHATWCRWEKAEGTCDCGLREHQDAASPPAADPLDVERLAEALHTAQPHWNRHKTTFEDHRDGHIEEAGAIAAEYARLTVRAAAVEDTDR
jgi:hypothetical protein